MIANALELVQAAAEPPVESDWPPANATKMFRLLGVLVKNPTKSLTLKKDGVALSVKLDRYSLYESTRGAVTAYAVDITVLDGDTKASASLRMSTISKAASGAVSPSKGSSRIPLEIRDEDVKGDDVRSALLAILHAIGRSEGSSSSLYKFSPESIKAFATGFLRGFLLCALDKNPYADPAAGEDGPTLARSGFDPADCDSESWTIAEKIAVRFFRYIAEPLRRLADVNQKKSPAQLLMDWELIGKFAYLYAIDGNVGFADIHGMYHLQGLEDFYASCEHTIGAIISGYGKIDYTMKRGKLHLVPQGIVVHAAAEPHATAGGIAGVLQRLHRVLGGSVSDSRLTLTPYLYIDVSSTPTMYDDGLAEVLVRFAGYPCYGTVVAFAGDDDPKSYRVTSVVQAVRSVVRVVRSAATESKDLDTFSIRVGTDLREMQRRSYNEAVRADKRVDWSPTDYTMYWDPKKDKKLYPSAWRALRSAYESLGGHA